MIDIISVAVGVFAGGCLGFIAGKLSSAGEIDRLNFHVGSLRTHLEIVSEDLHTAQKERLNLAAKLAINKPKRDKHGRFIPKSKGNK